VTAQEIETFLREHIRVMYLPGGSRHGLGDEENLFESGVLDSAGLVTFIGEIERHYGISIPDEDLLPENFASIAAMARYIRSQDRIHGPSNTD
jgi:acyl carrier protein